jgi:hypothetical protein
MAALIEANFDGELHLNWDSAPDQLKPRLELKEKLFNELQKKFPPGEPFDSRVLFEINKYAILRLKNFLKDLNSCQ